MKKLFQFLLVAVAAIAISSCTNVKEDVKTVDKNSIHISVIAKANDLAKDDVATKTYLGTDPDNNTPNTVLWGTGEIMKIGVFDGTATTFGDSDSELADYNDGQASGEFAFDITPANTSETYTFYGLYPASAAVASNNTNPASYKVNLISTQNATSSSYDPAAYIMVAKPESGKTITNNSASWVASFRRATALNKITLKNVPSGKSIKRVTITAPTGKYLAGARHIDLTTGESSDIYYGGGRTESVEVKYATPLTGTNVDVWFTSWGVEVAAGETLTIVAYTTDQKSYTKTITVPENKTIKFQEGYLNTLGANMSGIDAEDVTELEEGDYVVLAKDGDDYYALKAATAGNSNDKIAAIAYSGSTSAYAGDADLVWSVAKSGESYTIAHGNYFIGWTSGNTAIFKEAGDAIDIIWDGTNNCYHASLHSDATRKLQKNGSELYFAFYTSSQKDQLIFVPATVDTRAEVSLSFEEPEINLTTDNTEDFEGQAATAYSDGDEVEGLTITYSWDGDSDFGGLNEETGAIFLSGEPGTATVTATFAGNDTYRPATASYTIAVTDNVTGPQYVQVTSLSDVTSGTYVIVNDNHYLPNTTTSSNPVKNDNTQVIVSNSALSGVTDAMLWSFTGSAAEMTISNSTGAVLIINTNGNTGIRVIENSTAVWVIEAYPNVSGAFTMKSYDTAATYRYCATYNSDWRSYNSYNAANYKDGGKVYLYKLVDSRNEAPISWSAAIGTATMSAAGINTELPSFSNTESLAVTYASSAPAVATVDVTTGEITIVAGGTTTISATYDGSAASAPYKTTVKSYTLTVTDNRETVATPSFSPAAGEVASGITVTIASATSGATIWYTTGSSDFSAGDWTEYTAPVTVTAACTIKAIAVKANYKNSAVASAAYTIETPASTVSQVLAGGAGTYKINNLLVYSVVGNQAIVGDNTAKMVLYKSGHGLEVGDNISIPSATVDVYNGILQIQDGSFNENSNSNAIDHGTATNLNDATVASNTLTAFSASGYHAALFVTMSGTQSGRNITGNNATLYLSAANTTYDGKAVTVTGYIYYYNSNYSNYNFQLVSIEEDTSVPTISVSPASLSWAAAEYGNTYAKTLTVLLNDAADPEDYSYTVVSGTASEWSIDDDEEGSITIHPIAANTSQTAPKSITLKIFHTDDEDVYQEVTCTQAKASSGTGPAIGTVMWSETWQGGTAGETPAAYGQEGTTVYNGGSVTYTNGGTSTKLYDDTMSSTNLLLARTANNGTWTISGIPTGGVSSLTLSFETNNSATSRYAISTTTSGVSLGSLSVSGSASPYTVTATITITGTVNTFNLTFTNGTTSNVRLDNISIVTASN